MQTDVHRPARTMRVLPIALTLAMTFASSQVFIEVRSIRAWPLKALVISSHIGPENVFSATVVRIVETLNPAAAAEMRPALLRSTIASIDLVAHDICDWKSIRMSV